MCGLAGFLDSSRALAAAAQEALVGALISPLQHRGPDDSGIWVDAEAGIALGHRRLSVIDLSATGHQPMTSASGRYVIAFNGEIYNHLDLRTQLAGLAGAWRGRSDTETLLAGFEHWGVATALTKTVGMFAFALWDRHERVLTLGRDRLGEKPLYYGWRGRVFLFGSELKALQAHPAFGAEIDRDALALYLRHGYIPTPHSIYRKIFKLPAGTCLRLRAQDAPGALPQPRAYWSLRDVWDRALESPFRGGDIEATQELERLLKQAVGAQSIADVSLGAFLSGGVDSSTIVALMQAQSSQPVKTFTIGFEEAGYGEAHHARAVARHLGTNHTEVIVTARDALDVIPRLPQLFDEPFGDSSAIPTFLISQLARRHVTVSLSGDGGDELFGGYARYQRVEDIWRRVERVPYGARRVASRAIGAIAGGRRAMPGSVGNRLARYLAARQGQECYDAQTLYRDDTADFVLGSDVTADAPRGIPHAGALPTLYEEMMYRDAMTYLPDDILVKVDRAAMGVSLETRVPLLDHRVVEFACRLPLHLKVRRRERKWLLKQVMRRYLPAEALGRPKMGFGIPVGDWLRGPLREWAESLLGEGRLRAEGFLNAERARKQWTEHLKGARAGGDSLWHVLAFQAWAAAANRPFVPANCGAPAVISPSGAR